VDRADTLRRGRDAFDRRAWADACELLARAEREAPLGAEDLERMATASYLAGRDRDFLQCLERAYHAHQEAGDGMRAARCAFWLGLRLLLQGEAGRATAWLARARRLVEGRECVERGYLLLPAAEQHLDAGEGEAALRAAAEAAAIGEHFADADLVACARHLQGRALIRQGRVPEGLALLDEAMLAVTAGELSPIVTGLIYCSVIDACRQAYALGRAREWTSALAQWSEQQPQMVAFTSACLVHRAEILQAHGAWADAIEEARRACERARLGQDPRPPAAAFYQQGEIHRLRGEFAAAEQAYRSASRAGSDPQPGLALLRMAQGDVRAAAASIRRALGATPDWLRRTRLLGAAVDILLAEGELAEAHAACAELEEIARSHDTGVLGAMAAQARGALELAEGTPQPAAGSLRRAWQAWGQLDDPYEAARTRALLGLACRALGDEDGGRLELEAARGEFARLGAAPDLARLEALARDPRQRRAQPLTRRELQVLRLVASGRTNKAIAAELALSEKTVDRHLSNIFSKLDVPSRAGAVAHAYQHKLL
jgi:ATP/maltotriose-dependent transcriptional regulator MalT